VHYLSWGITDATEVLVIVGMLGAPTRREIEDRRGGEDCERLLVKARDDALRGDPNVFRLTDVALGATGHATLESFQRRCDGAVG
jgi:hypothetical protein